MCFLSGEFLLHVPYWLFFVVVFNYFYQGSFSYTSHAGIFIWGLSLTHPVLALILSAVLLCHSPCWLHFYLGSSSYTSRSGFILIWGVSLTHPALASFLCGEFVLLIPCCINFYAGRVSLTHPVLASSFFLLF